MSDGAKDELDLKKVVVFQLGSSTVRYAIAKQEYPDAIPALVAFPSKQGTKTQLKHALPEPTSEALSMRSASFKALLNTFKSKYTVEKPKPRRRGSGKFFDEVEGEEVPVFTHSNYRRDILPNMDTEWYWSEPETEQQKNLYGHDALHIMTDRAYDIVQPITQGRFNTTSMTLQGASDALEQLLEYIMTVKLGITASARKEYAVAMSIPDEFSRREIYEVYDIVLRRLGCKQMSTDIESVLSCFGAGVSEACVLDIGAEKTRVTCVKDGMVLPKTARMLPYGGNDLDQFLYWSAVKQSESENMFGFRSLDMRDPQHMDQLRAMKEELCAYMPMNEKTVPMKAFEFKFRQLGEKTSVVGVNVTSANVLTAMAVFDATLCAPSAHAKQMQQEAFVSDVSMFDFLDEAYIDEESTADPMETELELKPLDQLIADSIAQVEDSETRKNMATQLLLVGGTTKIPGLIDEMEERLIEALPRSIAEVDMVDVLDPKAQDHCHLTWKGASIALTSDGAKGCWISSDEWDAYGIGLIRHRIPFVW